MRSQTRGAAAVWRPPLQMLGVETMTISRHVHPLRCAFCESKLRSLGGGVTRVDDPWLLLSIRQTSFGGGSQSLCCFFRCIPIWSWIEVCTEQPPQWGVPGSCRVLRLMRGARVVPIIGSVQEG